MLVDQNPLTPLAPPPKSATEQAFDRLHAAIVALTLTPGSKVSEAEIATQLGVSRQPVRDAFFRLSQLGFLLIRPQRATLVTKISVAAVERAAFIRSALEVACLAEASTKRTDADLADLTDQLAQQQAAVAAHDGLRFYELDEVFHQTLCTIAGRPDIWPLIREHKSHMDRARRLSLPDNGPNALSEHAAIVTALHDQNLGAAQLHLKSHLFSLFPLMDGIRAKHPDYFEDDPQ